MAFGNRTPAADAGVAHRLQPRPRGDATDPKKHGVPGAAFASAAKHLTLAQGTSHASDPNTNDPCGDYLGGTPTTGGDAE